MKQCIALFLLTVSSLTFAGQKDVATCMDFDGNKRQCQSSHKNYVNASEAPLECRYKNGTCYDVFIENASECKLLKLEERCDNAGDLYGVDCQWDKKRRRCDAPNNEHTEKKCKFDQWHSEQFGCFDKKGQCKQYNFTQKNVCETKKDRMKCEYNMATKLCTER